MKSHPQSTIHIESTWNAQEDALEIRTESERVYMAGGEAWRKLNIPGPENQVLTMWFLMKVTLSTVPIFPKDPQFWVQITKFLLASVSIC